MLLKGLSDATHASGPKGPSDTDNMAGVSVVAWPQEVPEPTRTI